jgi:hypothetical protein
MTSTRRRFAHPLLLIWGALSLAAGLAPAACSSDPDPQSPPPGPAAGSGGGGGRGSPSGTGGNTAGSGGAAGSAGSGGSGGAAGSGGAGGSRPADAGARDAGAADGSGSAASPPGFPGWKYSRAITIDTTAAGAGVMGDVAAYPLAVILNAGNFDFSQARDRGEDVRFGKADGTPLPHAIESWDKAGQTAAVWVKIDQVKGNDATQTFNVYWGNLTEGDASDSRKVFATEEGFIGVWHLSDEPSMAMNGYRDATANEAHGSGQGMGPPARVPGRVGAAIRVTNAMNQWVSVSEKRALFNTQNKMTVSIWGNSAQFASRANIGGYDTIFSKGDSSWTIQKFSNNRTFEACVRPAGHLCSISRTQVQNNQWYHFVAVLDHPNLRFYVNGVAEGNVGGGGMWRAADHPVGIGTQSQYINEGRHWNGPIDEARVIAGVKDANWIKLDFESQKEGSKLLTFGPVQTR